MLNIKAFIFDLDGVITDTSHFHFLTWQKLAGHFGIDFDEKANENLKGVSRMDSLEWILARGNVELSDEEKQKWAAEKNEWYLEYIKQLSPADIFPGAREFLESTREAGIGISLGSSSKNARLVIDRLDVKDLFDCIVDGTDVTRSKPDPEIFLKGADCLDTSPEHCIVFEDAVSGVEAALRGGMYTVGVGDQGVLHKAHMTINGLSEVSPQDIIENLEKVVDSQ